MFLIIFFFSMFLISNFFNNLFRRFYVILRDDVPWCSKSCPGKYWEGWRYYLIPWSSVCTTGEKAVEVILHCPASVHSPCCGEAEQLHGYTPAELLRFSKSAACKMLQPHIVVFTICFIKYANHQSWAMWEPSTAGFFPCATSLAGW